MKIIAKAEIFDRIEQSFELFKNNFLSLFLPIFLYTFFTITLFMNVISYFGVKYGDKLAGSFAKKDVAEKFSFLQYDAQIIIGIIIFSILAILYVTIYISFVLGTYKSIKQGYNGEKITAKENVIYGFKNLFNSFKTYWYIFAYVVLIPALVGIIGGFLAIYGMQFGNENFTQAGAIISSFGLILFIFFSIYRGTKSTFAISSAIDKSDFTKENFNFSVKITKDKFWRILGNFLLIGLILSFATGIANQIIGLFGSSFDFNIESLANLKEDGEISEKVELVHKIFESYSPVTNFILNFLGNIVSTVSSVFVLIFTYIFFKRLEIENNPETMKEENIEL